MPAKAPGIINRWKTESEWKTPLLLILFVNFEWKKDPNNPMMNPDPIGAAGFLVISADELNTIPPFIKKNYYVKSCEN